MEMEEASVTAGDYEAPQIVAIGTIEDLTLTELEPRGDSNGSKMT